MATLLEQAKTALRLKTNNESIIEEITELLTAGLADLNHTAGVDIGTLTPASIPSTEQEKLTCRAAITYVRCHFGEPDEYDRLKASYDEQKAQLATAFRREASNGSDSSY